MEDVVNLFVVGENDLRSILKGLGKDLDDWGLVFECLRLEPFSLFAVLFLPRDRQGNISEETSQRLGVVWDRW